MQRNILYKEKIIKDRGKNKNKNKKKRRGNEYDFFPLQIIAVQEVLPFIDILTQLFVYIKYRDIYCTLQYLSHPKRIITKEQKKKKKK